MMLQADRIAAAVFSPRSDHGNAMRLNIDNRRQHERRNGGDMTSGRDLAPARQTRPQHPDHETRPELVAISRIG